jgi:hypothetical protein
MDLDPILATLEETDETDEGDGVMQRYLKAVYERLRFELTKRSNINERQWLYDMLKAYDWWIPAYLSKTVCNKLGISFNKPAYYRNIYVWLPDVRWGNAYMPCCPNDSCKTSHFVTVRGWHDNHFCRA